MKVTLAVVSLVLLCSFASAQTFGFASVGGGLYCNFEQLTNNGSGIWSGVDNLSACGASVNSTISGFNVGVPNIGLPTGGQGVAYGDSIYAVFSGDPFAQWTVFTRLACNNKDRYGHYLGHLGWFGLASFSGFFAGGNTGYLSCSIPGPKEAPTKGASTVSRK